MPYANLDDELWNHPKVDRLHGAAFELWICSISFCANRMSDGYLSESEARRLAAFREIPWSVADTLLVPPAPNENPFWDKVPGGYIVHNYLKRNRSRERLVAESAAAAARHKAWEDRQNGRGPDPPDKPPNGVVRAEPNGVSNGVANGVANTVPVPIPVPVRSSGETFDSAESNAATSAAAVSYRSFVDELRASRNQPATLARAITAIFGRDCTEFGRLGKLIRDNGAGETLKLAYLLVPSWNGVDEPLDLMTAASQKRRRDRRGELPKLPEPWRPEDIPNQDYAKMTPAEQKDYDNTLAEDNKRRHREFLASIGRPG